MLPPPPSNTNPSTSEDAQGPLDPDRSHPVVYAETCLRGAKFLLAVWENGGSMDKALAQLTSPLSASLSRSPQVATISDSVSSEVQARTARLISLSPSSTVPRSSIASFIGLAYGPHLTSLPLPVRLRLTGEIANLYGKIGYRRKEAFVLRELAALCGEGVSGKGIEVIKEAGFRGTVDERPREEEASLDEDIAGDLGASPRNPILPRTSNGVSPRIDVRNDRASIVRTTSQSTGNESIVRLLEKVCDSFGVMVVTKISEAAREKERKDKRRSLVQGRPVEIMEQSSVRRFGWPVLQVGVLRDAITIAEALPGRSSSAFLTLPRLILVALVGHS